MATNLKERKPLHLAKLHVHKGDTVLVLSGKDRGKQALVERTMPRENKVIVEGVNIAKKRVRATRIAHDRVPQGVDQKERSRRICKKCGQPITENTRS